MTTADEKRRKNEAYSAAEKRLKEENTERWQELVAIEMTARDLTYVRRLSPQEKAQEQIESLLSEYPDLRAKFAVQSSAAAGVVGTSPTPQ